MRATEAAYDNMVQYSKQCMLVTMRSDVITMYEFITVQCLINMAIVAAHDNMVQYPKLCNHDLDKELQCHTIHSKLCSECCV